MSNIKIKYPSAKKAIAQVKKLGSVSAFAKTLNTKESNVSSYYKNRGVNLAEHSTYKIKKLDFPDVDEVTAKIKELGSLKKTAEYYGFHIATFRVNYYKKMGIKQKKPLIKRKYNKIPDIKILEKHLIKSQCIKKTAQHFGVNKVSLQNFLGSKGKSLLEYKTVNIYYDYGNGPELVEFPNTETIVKVCNQQGGIWDGAKLLGLPYIALYKYCRKKGLIKKFRFNSIRPPLSYVEERLKEGLSVNALCEELGEDWRGFVNYYKKEYNKDIHEFKPAKDPFKGKIIDGEIQWKTIDHQFPSLDYAIEKVTDLGTEPAANYFGWKVQDFVWHYKTYHNTNLYAYDPHLSSLPEALDSEDELEYARQLQQRRD